MGGTFVGCWRRLPISMTTPALSRKKEVFLRRLYAVWKSISIPKSASPTKTERLLLRLRMKRLMTNPLLTIRLTMGL